MFSEIVAKGRKRVGGCLEAGNDENDSLELFSILSNLILSVIFHLPGYLLGGQGRKISSFPFLIELVESVNKVPGAFSPLDSL